MLQAASKPTTIVVPVDYGKVSLGALEKAVELAAAFGSKVIAVFAWAAPYATSPIASDALHRAEQDLIELVRKESAATMVEFLKQANQRSGVELDWLIVSGEPAAKIVALAAEKQADLIVIGSHNRAGVAHFLLGSVAEHVVRHAPCPTLVVPPTPLDA